MEISERLTILRAHLKLSQSAFAAQVGVASQVISNAEAGRNKPGFDVVTAILQKVPNVSARWLLLGEGEMWVTALEDGAAKLPKINANSGIELDKCQERLQAREREIEALRAVIAAKDELIDLLKTIK